jgi:uncharacterized protein HemX
MNQEQPYVPRPRSEGGLVVGLVAIVAALLLLGLITAGGLFYVYQSRAIEMHRAMEAEQRARAEAQRARAEAEMARIEALRANEQLEQAERSAP